jgi:hypothetical protein
MKKNFYPHSRRGFARHCTERDRADCTAADDDRIEFDDGDDDDDGFADARDDDSTGTRCGRERSRRWTRERRKGDDVDET